MCVLAHYFHISLNTIWNMPCLTLITPVYSLNLEFTVQYKVEFVCIKGHYGRFWYIAMPNKLGMISIYIKHIIMTETTKILPAPEMDLHHKRLAYCGEYLKQLRLNEGLTQYDAGSVIGISRNSLQNAESGRNVTFLTISKLTEFYDLSLSEFFTDVE